MQKVEEELDWTWRLGWREEGFPLSGRHGRFGKQREAEVEAG